MLRDQQHDSHTSLQLVAVVVQVRAGPLPRCLKEGSCRFITLKFSRLLRYLRLLPSCCGSSGSRCSRGKRSRRSPPRVRPRRPASRPRRRTEGSTIMVFGAGAQVGLHLIETASGSGPTWRSIATPIFAILTPSPRQSPSTRRRSSYNAAENVAHEARHQY